MESRYEGADGIRGLACLIVICVHASAFFFPATGYFLAGTGKIGVWLFFVLSAFLLTSKFIRSGFETSSVLGYAIGRFLRIVPLYSLVVLAYYVVGGVGINTGGDLFQSLIMDKGYGHLWTIPAEFKFYLVLPFIAFILIFIHKRFGVWGALLACLAFIAAQQALWPYWATPENSPDTRWYLSSFTIGSICSVIHHHVKGRITGRTADVLGILILALIVLSFPYIRSILFGMPIDKWLMNKFIGYSVLWAVFVLVLAEGKGYVGMVLKSLAFRKIGQWSFSVYLIHIMIYGIVSAGRQPSAVLALIGVGFAVLAGCLMYYLFEKPIEKFRHKIQDRIFKAT